MAFESRSGTEPSFMKKLAKPVLFLLGTTMLAGAFTGAWHGAGTELGAVNGAKESIMDVVQLVEGGTSYEISPHILPTARHAETGALQAQVPDGHYITRTMDGRYTEKIQHQLVVNKDGVAISAAAIRYNGYGGVSGYNTGDVDQIFRGTENSPELLAQRVKGFVAMANKATGQSIEVTGIRTYDGEQNHIIDITGVEVSEDTFMHITRTADYQHPVSRFLSEKVGFDGLNTGKVVPYQPPQIQNHWLENARDLLTGGDNAFHTLAANKTSEVAFSVEQVTNAEGATVNRFTERTENAHEYESSSVTAEKGFTEYTLDIPIDGTAADAVLTVTRGTETITLLGSDIAVSEMKTSTEDAGLWFRLSTMKEARELDRRIDRAKSNIETLSKRSEIETRAQAYEVAIEQFKIDFAEQLGALGIKPGDVNAETLKNTAQRVVRLEENNLRQYENIHHSTLRDIKTNRDRLPVTEVQAQLGRFEAEYAAHRSEKWEVISNASGYSSGDTEYVLRHNYEMVKEGRLDDMQAHVDALLAEYGSIENAETHLQEGILKGISNHANEITTAIRDKELPPTRETIPVLQPVTSNAVFKNGGPMI